MTHARPRLRRILLPVILALVAALALAACGSDSKSSTNTSTEDTTDTKATTDTSGAAAAVVIKTADNADLGTILVDTDGKTVYTLTKEDQPVACTGACLTAWPPVLLPAGTDTPTGADGVKDLALVSQADGKQVTSAGLPLYTFSGDAAAGDVNGEGLASFGGVWHVVKVTGAGSSTGAGAGTGSGSGNGSDDTTSTTSAYGY